ncbi:MAG: glycosyltransferase family 9 protein [Thermoguttaceae bacterium]
MSSRWKTARRVLCVRLDSLGDVLMTTPALFALKQAVRRRRLTLLTSTAGARLASLLPDVDDCIAYDAPWMKASPQRSSADLDIELIRRISEEHFDAAVIFTVFTQNPLPAALMCQLAGVPLRLAHCRENPYQLLTDWVREEEPETTIRHEVRRQLDLVETIDCSAPDDRLRLSVPPAASERIAPMLRRSGIDTDQPWIVVHPGGSAPSRRYPPELYAEVAATLSRRHGLQLVFSGVEHERAIVEAVRTATSGHTLSLVGRLELAELAALLAAAPLLLTNNTGPAHIAAALGTPVVDLYALTNPQHTPWKTPQRVLNCDVPCKTCLRSICPLEHHRCLRGVAPQTVVDAVLELLAVTAATRRHRAAQPPSLPSRPTRTTRLTRSIG